MRQTHHLILAIVTLVTFAWPARADSHRCSEIGEIASVIMAARQNGVSFDHNLQTTLRSLNPKAWALGKRLVTDAYATDRKSPKSAMADSVRAFKEHAELGCKQAGRSDPSLPRSQNEIPFESTD